MKLFLWIMRGSCAVVLLTGSYAATIIPSDFGADIVILACIGMIGFQNYFEKQWKGFMAADDVQKTLAEIRAQRERERQQG